MDRRCAVRLTRRYETDAGEVWRALTEPESVERWLGVVGVRLRTVEDGRVVELELEDSLARIELTSVGETTVLVVDHQRIPAEAGMGVMRRWTTALDRFDREVAA